MSKARSSQPLPTGIAAKPLDMVIVGAGFGGLCMAIGMQQAGRDNFVVLEKGNEVGGTWRDNQYPGAACDVQSHMYSFSFAPKTDWSKRYAGAREIQDYILDVTKRNRLRPKIRFGCEVVEAKFDEQTALWTLRGAKGEVWVTRHWTLASGPLHFPAIPNIPGLERFKGKVFHSAQWDHDYDLKGKRVASIGTGGSAIQYVPEIAPSVKQLDVYQRTAAWVIPRDTRSYSGLHKWIFKHVPGARKLHRARLYWTNESRVWPIFQPWLARTLQKLVVAFLHAQVKDPELRRKLTPDYTIGCKRVLISNVWYPTFNRDNVDLITHGIREITETGVITADGRERPTDCIILGTGFIVDPRIYMRNFVLTGRSGHQIGEDWKRAPEAYLGTTVTGYPNMYQLVGPGTGLGHNSIIFMIEAQVRYILQCLQRMDDKGANFIDVKPDVQRDYNAEMQTQLKRTVWSSGCRSWYQTADGVNFAIWPGSTWRYWLRMRKVRDEDYVWGKAVGVPQAAPAMAERA